MGRAPSPPSSGWRTSTPGEGRLTAAQAYPLVSLLDDAAAMCAVDAWLSARRALADLSAGGDERGDERGDELARITCDRNEAFEAAWDSRTPQLSV